jgi:hypothetical protein
MRRLKMIRGSLYGINKSAINSVAPVVLFDDFCRQFAFDYEVKRFKFIVQRASVKHMQRLDTQALRTVPDKNGINFLVELNVGFIL